MSEDTQPEVVNIVICTYCNKPSTDGRACDCPAGFLRHSLSILALAMPLDGATRKRYHPRLYPTYGGPKNPGLDAPASDMPPPVPPLPKKKELIASKRKKRVSG